MDNARLVRDLDDGVMAISSTGEIIIMNPRAIELLDVTVSYVGKNYTELEKDDAVNDSFYQMVVSAVGDHMLHRKKIKYIKSDGQTKYFDVTSSVMWGEDRNEKGGVILSFNDCTDSEKLKENIRDSSAIFLLFITLICTWVFIVMAWHFFGKPVRADFMSKALVVLLFIPVPFIQHHTGFSLEDLGLKFKKEYILKDTVVTVFLIFFMIFVKLIIMKVSPGFFGTGKFFRFNKYPLAEYIRYVFSVVGQEFITRGVVHETMEFVVQSEHKKTMSIVVSSLIFGAMHLHLGIIYMVSAAFLLGMLGLVYNKQKSIWGLCIPHYVLGMLLGIMDFVVY